MSVGEASAAAGATSIDGAAPERVTERRTMRKSRNAGRGRRAEWGLRDWRNTGGVLIHRSQSHWVENRRIKGATAKSQRRAVSWELCPAYQLGIDPDVIPDWNYIAPARTTETPEQTSRHFASLVIS